MTQKPVHAPSIVFAGTPEFASVMLGALLQGPFHVAAVLTQPDRAAGRGRKLRESPVKALARSAGIALHQPLALTQPAAQSAIAALAPDVMVVAAYGLLLPATILSMPRFGCINVHASLLPRWRGAAPIAHAILAGDRTTGISIMQMDEGLDTGPVIAREACTIEPGDTAGSLHDKLASIGASLLGQSLGTVLDARAAPITQDHALATYAPKLQKREAKLDFSLPADTLQRRIRAFNPWPVAYTTLAGSRIRIWSARNLRAPASRAPGTVERVDTAGIEVATGAGRLQLTRVQLPGARVVSAADFLNANTLRPGERFGE